MEKKSFFSSLMGGDNWIWGIYWILFFISIVELASASSLLAYKQVTNDNPLVRHTMFLIVGFFFFVLTFQSLTSIRVRYVVWAGRLAYIGGFLLMCLLPVIGTARQGAVRDIGGIQPVEFLKVGLIIILCEIIATPDESFKRIRWFREHTSGRKFWLMVGVIVFAAVPIALQNLSTALILGMTAAGIMFAGQIKAKYMWKAFFVGGAIGLVLVGALGGLHVINSSHVDAGGKHYTALGPLDRANTWESRIFDNSSDIPIWDQKLDDDNMQVLYAHMAIANSNGIGRFFGESQLRDYLPEAYSDYIYCIIFEETGVLGAVLVMLLYFVLFVRCYIISTRTDDKLKRLLMLGLPLLIIIQALIHMGVCCNAMFVTGQPLPLISRGGMSILSTSAVFGILVGLSRNIAREKDQS